MSFVYPFVLFFTIPALLLIPLIKKRRFAVPFNKKIIVRSESPNYALLPAVLALVLIALARPVSYKSVTKSQASTPLFIAIDFSNSMLVEDVEPNRLTRAKQIAKELIRKSPFKTALIVFTTNPLLIAPPTTDKEALFMALESIDQKSILTKGTNFSKLVHFVAKFKGKKNLAIISDGGDFSDAASLMELAKRNNIQIFSVGVGTKEGGLIPAEDGYLKQQGNLVVSRLNLAFKKLGRYYERDYLQILDDIEAELSRQSTKEKIELFFIPLLAAFLLYLHIYTKIFEMKKLRFFILLVAVGAHASLVDEFMLKRAYTLLQQQKYQKAAKILKSMNYLEARFALGVALCQMGKVPEAIKVFEHIRSKEPKIKEKLYYNLGLCYERLRNYKKALKYYIRAYQLRQDVKTFAKIQKLVFKKNPKKPLLPFAKQKVVSKEGQKSKEGKKSAGGSNINLAIQSGGAKGGKKQKARGVSKKAKAIPLSSRVYDLINKGYIDEKNPW